MGSFAWRMKSHGVKIFLNRHSVVYTLFTMSRINFWLFFPIWVLFGIERMDWLTSLLVTMYQSFLIQPHYAVPLSLLRKQRRVHSSLQRYSWMQFYTNQSKHGDESVGSKVDMEENGINFLHHSSPNSSSSYSSLGILFQCCIPLCASRLTSLPAQKKIC